MVLKQYKNGERFLFLGEYFTLKIDHYTKIEIVGSSLHFPQAILFRAKKELGSWYRREALDYIKKRVVYYSQRMNVQYTSVAVADTKSRWGACSPDNRLQFNWRLIMTPHAVLDSVVVHELAHVIVKNHSKDFWRYVLRAMPGYKVHRAWINHNMNKLII